MTDEERQAELQRIEALIQDKWHVRKHALRLAGIYLRGADSRIASDQLEELDDDIKSDDALYTAHEELVGAIVKEIVVIADEL